MISAENRSEDCSVRNLLGLPGSRNRTRTTEDSTLCGREPGGDASDNNGGSLSVDEQIALELGPSLAAGLPAEESRNNGRPDSSRQPGQIRRFHPATVSVRGSPTAKHFDQAVRNVTQSKRTPTTPSLPPPKTLEKQLPVMNLRTDGDRDKNVRCWPPTSQGKLQQPKQLDPFSVTSVISC
jgi:hypothetical protein